VAAEVLAERAERAGRAPDEPDTAPLPAVPSQDAPPPGWPLLTSLARLPARIRHGRPLRLLIRAAITAALCLAVLTLIPGQAAAPADVAGVILWFTLTGRRDVAPPPER
jgi:hypothetical protein